MLKASGVEVLQAFKYVHGDMGRICYAKVIEDDEGNIIGAGCFKDGKECWRATLEELSFDILVNKALEQRHDYSYP